MREFTSLENMVKLLQNIGMYVFTRNSHAKSRCVSLTGFTIIETLVAIAVLTIAIIGPFYAVQSALTSSYVARDQLIASSLAQEGIEYIRSIRDNNFLNGRTWVHLLSTYSCYGATPSNYCTVDPTQGDPHSDPNLSAAPNAIEVYSQTSYVPPLYVSATNLYNQQSSGTQSRFKRYLQIQQISATEARITVTVTWTTAKIPYTLTLTGYINDWL